MNESDIKPGRVCHSKDSYLDAVHDDKPLDALIARATCETFDYTQWQRKLWNGMDVEEIHAMGTEFEKNVAHKE